MARVYVSSTVADLTEERQAVLNWLRLARHQAVDSYLPDSDTVRDSCLDDVARCDLYVLMAGHRYGFQPSDDNPEGLSITQLEFRRAGQCGIPRVALLRTSIPDVSLSDLGDPQRLALVSAFRDEVARQVRPAQFSDLQGLIQGLSTGIQSELDKLDKQQAGQISRGRGADKVFLSYVREDAGRVDRLQRLLEAEGITVWRDTSDLWPGQDWKLEIRRAIESGVAFVACFSEHTGRRITSYQNEELAVAVDEMRRRPPGTVWLLPVRFADCLLPPFDLGPGRNLDSIQRVDLFDGAVWEPAVSRLVIAVRNMRKQARV